MSLTQLTVPAVGLSILNLLQHFKGVFFSFFFFPFFPFRGAAEQASVNITGNSYGLQVKTKDTHAIETQMVVYGSMRHHQTTENS